MTLAALLGAAVALWGVIYPGQVNIQSATPPAGTLAYTYPGQGDGGATWVYLAPNWYLVASRTPCRIDVSPNYVYWPAWLQNKVVQHELGHCFGMQHSATLCDIMYSAFSQCQYISSANRQQARANMGER